MARFVQIRTVTGGQVLTNPDLVRIIASDGSGKCSLIFSEMHQLVVPGDPAAVLSQLLAVPEPRR